MTFRYLDGPSIRSTAEGSFVASGVLSSSTSALVRLTPQGQFDATFGDGGTAVPALGSVAAPLLQTDGSLTLLTTTDSGYAGCPVLNVEHVRGDGTRNPVGLAQPALGGGTKYAQSIHSQLDGSGRIVVGATTINCRTFTNLEAVIARLAPNGRLDPAFGSGGITNLTDLGLGNSVTSLVVLSSGATLATVAALGAPACRTVRLDANGRLDPSFGTAGAVNPCHISGVDQTGRIVFTNRYDVVERRLPNGALDGSFGSGGRVLGTPLDAVRLMNDGSLIVVRTGYSPATGETVELRRLDASGMPDGVFGGDGVLRAAAISSVRILDVAVGITGRVLVAIDDSAASDGPPAPFASQILAFPASPAAAPSAPLVAPAAEAIGGVGGVRVVLGAPAGGYAPTGPAVLGYRIDTAGREPLFVRAVSPEAWLDGLPAGRAVTITARALFANGATGPPSTTTAAPTAPQTSHYLAAPTPRRLQDTRLLAIPRTPAGGTVNVSVTGGALGAPANASAVVLNVTATESIGPGYITVFPTRRLPAQCLQPQRRDGRSDARRQRRGHAGRRGQRDPVYPRRRRPDRRPGRLVRTGPVGGRSLRGNGTRPIV